MKSSAQAASFAAWLRRHGGNLTVLALRCGTFMPKESAAAAREVQPELPQLFVALASTATRLERLHVHFYLPLAAALPLPPSLTRLSLGPDLGAAKAPLPEGWLGGLTQLEALHLSDCRAPSPEQVRRPGGLQPLACACRRRLAARADARLRHHIADPLPCCLSTAGGPAAPLIPQPDGLPGAPHFGVDQA